MRTSSVFIFLVGFPSLSGAFRPDGEAESSSIQVAFSPRGQGHKQKSDEVERSEAAEAASFTSDELHAAFHDHSKPMPEHILNAPASMLQEGYGRRRKLGMQFSNEGKGQILRGTLDFFGYAFALHMDRADWYKKTTQHWLTGQHVEHDVDHAAGPGAKGRTWWEAHGKLSFKLLRYPKTSEGSVKEQETYGRSAYNGRVDLQHYLESGWEGVVELVGWWNDETMHFRGKAITTKANDLDWLHHAMLPWREIDLRFDNEGASGRFDWYLDKGGSWWSKLKDNLGTKEYSWGMFRLDALPQDEDPAKVYMGMGFTRNVLSIFSLRLDNAKGTSDSFQCSVEQRPISVSDPKLYLSPPYGAEGKGLWFSTMTEKGSLDLQFTADAGGKFYTAEPLGSSCWGQVPCPFIVQEKFVVQFAEKHVVLHQKESSLSNGGDNPADIFLYPLFDDAAMSQSPDGSNPQGLDREAGTLKPDVPEDEVAELKKALEEKDQEIARLQSQSAPSGKEQDQNAKPVESQSA